MKIINFLGYAYEWGACNRSNVDMNTEAVGIVEDNGGYSAIIPAAHEVAHLLVNYILNLLNYVLNYLVKVNIWNDQM